jgi:thioredoxin-related protein
MYRNNIINDICSEHPYNTYKMKQLLFTLLLFVSVGIGSAFAQSINTEKGQLTWTDDLLKAYEQSKATGKPIFAFFTGSDWCGWCHKLQNEVFSKPAFIKWAKEKVILLELDFPRHKQLSPEITQQNQNLQQAFQVAGFPTVWLFFATKDEKTNNLNLNPLGSTGYPQGAELGHEEVKFLQNADAIIEKAKSVAH